MGYHIDTEVQISQLLQQLTLMVYYFTIMIYGPKLPTICSDHHASIWVKLDAATTVHWCVLYNWYSNMKAVIRWNGNIHNMYFNVTRGTRQAPDRAAFYLRL